MSLSQKRQILDLSKDECLSIAATQLKPFPQITRPTFIIVFGRRTCLSCMVCSMCCLCNFSVLFFKTKWRVFHAVFVAAWPRSAQKRVSKLQYTQKQSKYPATPLDHVFWFNVLGGGGGWKSGGCEEGSGRSGMVLTMVWGEGEVRVGMCSYNGML